MNYNFFRRVTSSIFASLFAFSIGVGSFKSVNAEQAEVINTCQKNAGKFSIPLADKQPLRIAVSNSVNTVISKAIIKSSDGKTEIPEYQFKGLGDILAGKLREDSNFRVKDWNRIKPVYSENNNGKRPAIPQNQINLKDLHKLRDDYGIEAVLFVTVNDFQLNGETATNIYLFGKKKKFNDVYVTLNFRLIDTTTGDIVDSGKGDGHQNESYTSGISTPKIQVENIQLDKIANWKPTITIQFNQNHKLLTTIKVGIEKKLLAVAVENAINQLIQELSSNSNQTSCLLRKPTVVADVDQDEKTVTLTKGKSHGFYEDMELSFQKFDKVVKNLVTGKVIRIKTNRIKGVKIRLTEVHSDFSVGEIIPDSSEGNKTEVNLITLRKIKRLSEEHKLFAKPIPTEKSVSSQNATESNTNQQNQGDTNTNSAKTKTQSSITYPYTKVSRSAKDLKS